MVHTCPCMDYEWNSSYMNMNHVWTCMIHTCQVWKVHGSCMSMYGDAWNSSYMNMNHVWTIMILTCQVWIVHGSYMSMYGLYMK